MLLMKLPHRFVLLMTAVLLMVVALQLGGQPGYYGTSETSLIYISPEEVLLADGVDATDGCSHVSNDECRLRKTNSSRVRSVRSVVSAERVSPCRALSCQVHPFTSFATSRSCRQISAMYCVFRL